MKTIGLVVALLSVGCGSGSGSNASDGGGQPSGMSGIFPPDNAWNLDISSAGVDPMSDRYLANIGAATGMHADYDAVGDGIPYVEVPGNQPRVPVTFTLYGSESDPGPYPIPDNAPIENASDGHVLVVDRANGFLYELDMAVKANGWTAAGGAQWDLKSNAGRTPGFTSADAAGLPIFPGLVRYDEVTAGVIPHALRFTVVKTQKGYVAPASHAAGSCPLHSDCPPMGLRLRLKASFDLSTYPPSVQVILTALKKYGMFVADNGSNWYLSGEPNTKWNDDDMHKLGSVKGSDFEVVTAAPITAYP